MKSQFKFVGTKKKVQKCIDKISGQGGNASHKGAVGQDGRRTYKHYVQSYHEDEEITPEQAHKNAVELAEHTKAWKGHEVLIATHIDKGHIHTHFIVNSVNYENGHKLQWM